MKRTLSVKWIALPLVFLLAPLSLVVFSQDDDSFEADWSDDALDESTSIKQSPAPVQAKKNTPVKAAQKETADIEPEEDLPDFESFEAEPAAKPAPKPKVAPPPVQKAEPVPQPVAPVYQAAPAVAPPPVVSKPKAVFEPISQTQSNYNVGSAVKRAGSPLVLITRPVYAPYSNEEKTMYISAVAEAYFHFKIGALPGVQVISTERIANNIQYFRDFTRRISRSSYIDAAKKIGATYLFYQEYEPKGKKVKIAIELYSISENKKIAGTITEIALADFENGLFDFVNEAAGAMIGALPKETQEFLAAPVLGANERQIELLGNAIVSLGENSQKSAEKAVPDFEKLSKDRVMQLAKYIGAQTMAHANQYDKAIVLQQQLITSFGQQYPALSLQMAEYYRLQGSFNDAIQAARDAARAPSLKLPSQIEMARIHEAEGKLDQAKRDYESVLSDGGEDGDIYFQLALVSIGLNDLQQSERYLEKTAAAGRELNRGDYFDLGLRYAALGSANEQAIKAFRSCLGLQQDNELAWQKLAEIYSTSGKGAEAAECYVSLFQINNETYKDYLLKAGTLFESAGYLDNAKDAYSLFIARRYDNPEVTVRLAKLEMQGGNCPKAIELVDNMDTTGEFGQDILAINSQCGKQERRVVIPTETGRNKGWQAVFFWRVASGVIAAGGIGVGYLFNNMAVEKHEAYKAATNVIDVTDRRKELESTVSIRNICYAGAGIGIGSLALSITLPIVFSNK